MVNLKDFLTVFRDELEYENAEKWDAIEEMKASMQIQTCAAMQTWPPLRSCGSR